MTAPNDLPEEEVYAPGVVALGCVRTPKEKPGVRSDKWRPIIVLGTLPRDRVLALGLTTKTTYETGAQRTPLCDWDLIPLPVVSYLWSPKPVVLPRWDVGRVIGRLSSRDIELIILFADLTAATTAALRAALAD